MIFYPTIGEAAKLEYEFSPTKKYGVVTYAIMGNFE
jgi:hypothetical protein